MSDQDNKVRMGVDPRSEYSLTYNNNKETGSLGWLDCT